MKKLLTLIVLVLSTMSLAAGKETVNSDALKALLYPCTVKVALADGQGLRGWQPGFCGPQAKGLEVYFGDSGTAIFYNYGPNQQPPRRLYFCMVYVPQDIPTPLYRGCPWPDQLAR